MVFLRLALVDEFDQSGNVVRQVETLGLENGYLLQEGGRLDVFEFHRADHLNQDTIQNLGYLLVGTQELVEALLLHHFQGREVDSVQTRVVENFGDEEKEEHHIHRPLQKLLQLLVKTRGKLLVGQLQVELLAQNFLAEVLPQLGVFIDENLQEVGELNHFGVDVVELLENEIALENAILNPVEHILEENWGDQVLIVSRQRVFEEVLPNWLSDLLVEGSLCLGTHIAKALQNGLHQLIGSLESVLLLVIHKDWLGETNLD